jgi:spore coat polysaccharide biosynthesis protein SpsF
MKNNKNKTRINIEGFQTEQEKFWAGKFGEEYITRNQERTYLANNIALFGKILARTNRVDSVIEFGANIGINLLAIKQLIPEVELSAIEINEKAVDTLNKIKKSRFIISQL